MGIEGPFGYADLAGDIVDGGPMIAFLDEQLQGGFDDFQLGIRPLFHYPSAY
jgi:hypothetical protein